MIAARSPLVLFLAAVVATLLFWLVLHQVAGLWLDVALRPDVATALQRSMEDQKRLRALDATRSDEYRRRFEATRILLQRLQVLRMSREAMLQRFELALVALFAFASAAAVASARMRYRLAQEKERRAFSEQMAGLQDTARRHAHELKGPITAARLELERAGDLVRSRGSESDVLAAMQSATDELERLSRFARQYSSLGGIGTPVLRRESLGSIVQEFCATFANAWPGIALEFEARDDVHVCADRDLVRQVLVNLCTNSALAQARAITFTIARRELDVADDGRGIPESIAPRIFDPYVTTRQTGEGMGLGLPISRKIMLDHGGDLRLLATSSGGTTFRLTFQERGCN